ncbi:MAG TPA: hypothetical protein P5081_19650 [Phycisphaerae bacterium]|nr:hypothetical protein [Phycisphaerae bacterium]HRW55092.1 hypothetical protein [Phycisphaerae bacterium]
MTKLLSFEELVELYGPEYVERVGPDWGGQESMDLEKRFIPRSLWSLIPYARFWGISDDCYRDVLNRDASEEAIAHLKVVYAEFEDALEDWLAGPEAENENPTDEYIAFSAMGIAAS